MASKRKTSVLRLKTQALQELSSGGKSKNQIANALHKFINKEQYNAKQQTQVTDFFLVILYVKSHKLCF